MTKSDFAQWLEAEMEDRHLTQVKLAEMSGVSSSHISRIIAGDRLVGEYAIVAIARALHVPAEQLFRMVGLLSSPSEKSDELIERIIVVTKDLPEEEKQNILEYARLRHRIAERGKHENKGTKRRTSPSESG